MGHNVGSLGRRRTCWIAKAVKVDDVCDASGGVKEGAHEGLEAELLSVGNLERRQLVFSDILVVDSDQRQSNIGATMSRQLLPLLHSTRDLVQSSHQRLEILWEFCLRPEFSINPRHCHLQTSEIIHSTVQARLQSQHAHRNNIFDRRVYGVKTCLEPPSFCFKVLTKFYTVEK